MSAVKVAAEIAAAVRTLARHRCNALILWDPDFEAKGGVSLDARVHQQLLLAIHAPDPMNPLRTGVTVVRGPRIERAAVPMTWDDLVERAEELGAGIAIVIADSGDIRCLNRGCRVDAALDADELVRVLHRRALRGRSA